MSQEVRNLDLHQIYFAWVSQSSFIKFQDAVADSSFKTELENIESERRV